MEKDRALGNVVLKMGDIKVIWMTKQWDGERRGQNIRDMLGGLGSKQEMKGE